MGQYDIELYLRYDMDLYNRLQAIGDPRKNPEIPLSTVLGTVALMPLFNIRSILAADREARAPELKHYLHSKRTMSCSDTTIMRVLEGISLEECGTFLKQTARILNRAGMFHSPILENGRSRRIGILDGTVMSGHYLLVLDLHGKIDMPVEITNTGGRGYELSTAINSMKWLRQRLGILMPDLLMGDALYFTKPMARCCLPH